MLGAAMPTIALVDDDRNILTSVSIALEAEGYCINTYTDGASAIDGFKTALSIGVGSGPQISIQKGPPRFAFRTTSVRPVGAGRDCGDGASAG